MGYRDIGAVRLRRLIWRRTRFDASLVLAVFAGVLIASTVLAGAPIYLRSLERVGVAQTSEDLAPRFLNFTVVDPAMPFTRVAFEARRQTVVDATALLDGLSEGEGHFVQSTRLFWGPLGEGVMLGDLAPRAVLHRMDGLEANVTYVEGGPPDAGLVERAELPLVEVSVPAQRAAERGVAVGDVLELAPTPEQYDRLTAIVSGLFTPNDLRSTYWAGYGTPIVSPSTVTEGRLDPLVLFVRGDTIWEVADHASLAVGTGRWFHYVDPLALRNTLTDDVVNRIADFRAAIGRQIPGARIFAGPADAFQSLDRRAEFARIPTLLMGALLLSVTAYYLLMVAGLLAERRRDDIGMLRSRGIGTLQTARIYAIEALPYGYYDLAVRTPDGLFVADQVANVAPSAKAEVSFTVQTYERAGAESVERRTFPPAADEQPAGIAAVSQKMVGASFWRSPKGIAVGAGGAALILLLLAGGGSSASPFVP